MKHPQYEVLQDYFENALDTATERRVKNHLLECDVCTGVLADFTFIETRVRTLSPKKVSQTVEAKILAGASGLLKERRRKLAEKQSLEKLRDHVQEWKDSLYPELRVPALQLCSLSLVLTTILAMEKLEGRVDEEWRPLNSEVSIVTRDEKGEI